MPKGIELDAETLGSGPTAERGKVVTIRYSGYLNRGDAFQEDVTHRFEMGKREAIAGLEFAVEGMKVGGRRRVKVSPHLCYRDTGVPARIPPHALLIFDIELVAVEGQPDA